MASIVVVGDLRFKLRDFDLDRLPALFHLAELARSSSPPPCSFGFPDDGLHSPNEKFKIDNDYRGLATIAHFFEQLAE